MHVLHDRLVRQVRASRHAFLLGSGDFRQVDHSLTRPVPLRTSPSRRGAVTLASTALRLRLFTQRPCDSRPYDAPKVRFSATLEEETEVEVGLVLWKRATPET